MFKTAAYWFAALVLALVAGFLFLGKSLISDMVVFIAVLSGIVILYLSKKGQKKPMTKRKRAICLLAGLLITSSSFINQILEALGVPFNFWNPPWSMGEFGILLSGLSVVFFALMDYEPAILPAAAPAIIQAIFQVYEHYRDNIEWIAAPLLEPTTNLTVAVLNLIGIKASSSSDYIITFLDKGGEPMSIQIIIDCTGIWSLSAFTASLILVSLAFPKVFSKKALPYLIVGYAGTYSANILRVVSICASAYLYGDSGATHLTHMNAGWMAFSGWMLIFWYFFFSRFLLKKEAAGAKQ